MPPIIAPWVQQPDYLRAMQSGAGLGLQIRSQRAQEEQQAAANALQQQNLFQQQQRQQAELQQQAVEAQMRQQNAAATLMQQSEEAQIRRANSMDALRLQQGFHEDTLAEQARDNARADAAAQLQGKRFDRQIGLDQQRVALDEKKLVAQENAMAGRGAWKMNQANQFVDEVKKSLPNGRQLTSEDESNLRSKFIGGGVNAINAPAKVVDAVNAEDVNSQRLDDVAERINKFNEKYGAKAFDEFVGPVDAPVFKFRARTLPPEDRSQAEKEAREIHRKVKLVVQDYRKANFGTALTATESNLFREIVSDEAFADYTDSINTFNGSMKDAVTRRIRNYEFAPNIPRESKLRFLWNQPIQQAQSQQQSVNAGDGTLTPAKQKRLAELRAKRGK